MRRRSSEQPIAWPALTARRAESWRWPGHAGRCRPGTGCGAVAACAGAATTARSDDLEFLAIRRVAPAGPRPPVPASAGWRKQSRLGPGRADCAPSLACRLWTCDVWRGTNAQISPHSSRRYRRGNGRRRHCARGGGYEMWLPTSSATTSSTRVACWHTWSAADSGRIRSTPPPWRDTTRAPRATAGIADRSPAAPGAAGGAGRQGRTRRGANSSPGHPAPARTTARDSAGTAAARAAHRVDRSGHRRALANPRRAARRHRPRLFRRSGAGGARYGRGAADDHSWPPRRHERAIWPRPTEVCRPPPQLTGSRRDSQARASDSQHDEVASRDFRTTRP